MFTLAVPEHRLTALPACTDARQAILEKGQTLFRNTSQNCVSHATRTADAPIN